MVNLNTDPRWKDIQKSFSEMECLVRELSNKGCAELQELGRLSFELVFLTEQTEKIITSNKN